MITQRDKEKHWVEPIVNLSNYYRSSNMSGLLRHHNEFGVFKHNVQDVLAIFVLKFQLFLFGLISNHYKTTYLSSPYSIVFFICTTNVVAVFLQTSEYIWGSFPLYIHQIYPYGRNWKKNLKSFSNRNSWSFSEHEITCNHSNNNSVPLTFCSYFEMKHVPRFVSVVHRCNWSSKIY